MPETQVAIDPQILKGLLDAEQFCRLLGSAGQRLEFWEAYALLRFEPAVVAEEVARLSELVRNFRPVQAGAPILEKLRFIRSDMGPLVQHLRQFFSILPEPVDPSRLDLILVFIIGSPQGREAAVRWVADPVSCREEASVRLKVMTGMADSYRRALLNAHIAASPAEAPSLAEEPEEPVEPPPRGPDPLLGALRLAGKCLEVLEGMNFRPETWELLVLATTDPAGMRSTVEELRTLKARGKPGEFAGAAYAFRQTVARVREQLGDWVGKLREYLEGLNLSGWDFETEGIVMGMLVTSPMGRERAERWLERPRESLRKSANFVGSLVTRAIRCLKELKENPEP